MELDDLKALWREDFDNLQSSLALNKQMISESTLKKSMTQYEKHRKMSIAGRNMALIYATISIVYAIYLFTNPIYSIPLLIGAAAMIYSFTQHLAIESKVDYNEHSIIELQRRIQRFRIHTAKHKKYDGGIVLIWLLTLAPPFLFHLRGFNVYGSLSNFFTFAGIALAIFLVLGLGVNKLYQVIDDELYDAEGSLEEIEMFEGFQG